MLSLLEIASFSKKVGPRVFDASVCANLISCWFDMIAVPDSVKSPHIGNIVVQ